MNLLEYDTSEQSETSRETRSPKVLNKYKDPIPDDAVYIGRPSKWGNPFPLAKGGDRQEVIEKYTHWIVLQPHLIEAAKRELRGKYLVCFCAPLLCHGDVLQMIADQD